MRKYQVVMMAVVVVSASSAVLAATASAEPTLLAEWLVSGESVTATLSTTTTAGTILLEDNTFGAAVECTGILDGTVGANGVGETTLVLTAAGVEVTLAKPLTVAAGNCKDLSGCSASSATEVSPLNLPWHTLMDLGTINFNFTDNNFMFGAEIVCTILGIKATDECSLTNGSIELLAPAEGAEAFGAMSPHANCSVGGTGKGEIEAKGANHLLTSGGQPVLPASE